MHFINIIESYRKVVAICDSEILGKKFEEGKKQLHLKESFYQGEKGKKVSEEELIKLIEINKLEDATFNIVGEKSINTPQINLEKFINTAIITNLGSHVFKLY